MTDLQIAERLVATAREPMVVLDAEWRIVAVSPRFESDFATSNLMDALRLLLGSDAVRDVRVVWDRPYSSPRVLLVNRTNLPGGMLLAIEDVTEIEARESLLHEAAHNLRSPLATSTSFLQLIQRDAKDRLAEEDLQRLDRALANLRRLQTLIRDGLVFLTHETAASQFEVASLEIPLRAALDQLKADINVDIGPLPDVNTDSRRMALVFEHLIANSIRFRRADPLLITVRATRAGAQHHLTIRDNGQGFDPRHAEQIFAPLKRLHSPDVPGSGLGLAICRRAVESLGGRIWAEGVRGEGTTFHIYLPA